MPPLGVALAAPSLPPKHFTLVTPVVTVNAVGWFNVTDVFALQRFASFTVTV